MVLLCYFFFPAKILGLNASHWLKAGGHFVISIKAKSIDSKAPALRVIQDELYKLSTYGLHHNLGIITFEPLKQDHACVTGASTCVNDSNGSELTSLTARMQL